MEYGKKLRKAGAGSTRTIKMNGCADLGYRMFDRGIGQKEAYERCEEGLGRLEVKLWLCNLGMNIYNALDNLYEELENKKNIPFNELQNLFARIDSKERLVGRFEQLEAYVRRNLDNIQTERDLRNLRRMFKI